jgi:hypothetical protein
LDKIEVKEGTAFMDLINTVVKGAEKKEETKRIHRK